MKTYEKPKLMVLSVSANDALCGGCEEGTRGNATWKAFDTDGDGVFTKGEGGLFADAADGCTTQTDVKGYCKFTAPQQYSILLFTS